MKVYYFNDERKDIVIQVQSQTVQSEYITVPAGQGKILELDAPEGSIPFVKRWETRQCLVSYLPKKIAEAMEEDDARRNEPSDPVSGAV